MKFVCFDCERAYMLQERSNPFLCDCGGLLEVKHDFQKVDVVRLKLEFDKRLTERMSSWASGVWRYKELIYPEMPEAYITSRYEGNTGLYPSETLAQFAGVRKLMLKAQSENPSGSFKDNGMSVAVSHGRSLGYTRFTCTSTGNTSSSLAMYAAWAGCSSYVFLPRHHISMNKVLQTLAYGAQVISFEGTYDDGIRFSELHSEQLGLYVCNSINPFRIEGQKSIVFEIAQQLRWQMPDWIVVPGGALSNATALGKGLHELKELGFIDKLPRVAVVQAEGASPFHQLVAQGDVQLKPALNPYTRATAMNIGNPPSWKKALHYAILHTEGVTVSVTDEEIMLAKGMINRSGIGCEPASAASVAGLRKLAGAGIIDKECTVVCLLTGHILKDTEAIQEVYNGDRTSAAPTNPMLQTSNLTVEEVRPYIADRQ
ncbi:threonine synthase [Paenibacillus sp. 1_12]|uniref:threonine synthase n=1 Tax=Paenibacillus sp. 1_12 TaxID=1566278 RepID=UPI0008E53142|nr:threonine synthase [Paenibacillus sp. 1_12]SFL26256.1 threonine synthase [Paenibacillus sp. 1_12]